MIHRQLSTKRKPIFSRILIPVSRSSINSSNCLQIWHGACSLRHRTEPWACFPSWKHGPQCVSIGTTVLVCTKVFCNTVTGLSCLVRQLGYNLKSFFFSNCKMTDYSGYILLYKDTEMSSVVFLVVHLWPNNTGEDVANCWYDRPTVYHLLHPQRHLHTVPQDCKPYHFYN